MLDDYITDVLMRDLVGHDRKPVSFLVYLWLAAEQARTKREIRASYQQVAESVGISKSSAQAAIRWLLRRKLLSVQKETVTATPVYAVRTPWRDTARTTISRKMFHSTSPAAAEYCYPSSLRETKRLAIRKQIPRTSRPKPGPNMFCTSWPPWAAAYRFAMVSVSSKLAIAHPRAPETRRNDFMA
jgi:hypothetical protein